jgi:hypothetical protein
MEKVGECVVFRITKASASGPIYVDGCYEILTLPAGFVAAETLSHFILEDREFDAI